MNLRIVLLVFFTAIYIALGVSMAFAATESEALDIQKGIIDEQLKNSEIGQVRDAVDKAFDDVNQDARFHLHANELLEDAAKGMPMKNLKGFPKVLLTLLGKEIRGNIFLVLQLVAVMILAAVLKGLQPKEKGLSNETAKLAVNATLAVIAAASFGGIVRVAQGAIESMQTLASIAMPALFALMASSGKIVSVAAIQPLMLVGVNIACHIFKTVLLPLTIMAGVLFLVDSISERFKLKTLAKLLKSCAVWATGAITLAFSIAVSVQKFASTSVDAVAVKTAKFALGTFVPVAGKNMSDAAEMLLACTGAARNAAGILTIIGLAITFCIPFIKVFVIMLTYRLAAAFGSPLCDEDLCDALEDASGCMSVMLGIMGASLFVLIILTATLMSSSGLLN